MANKVLLDCDNCTEHRDTCDETFQCIVEQPPSPPEIARFDSGKDESTDVLELHYSGPTFIDEANDACTVRSVRLRKQKTPDRGTTESSCRNGKGNRPKCSKVTAVKKVRSKCGRRETGKSTLAAKQQRERSTLQQDERHSWIVRWMRTGYEQLVYDTCNFNEMPNVIFAGLCYRQCDVYTMVLRNCNCKRRYWYDRTSRRSQRVPRGKRIGDFERAMSWRADAVGRSCTSPGYDVASFALENVASDKRRRVRATPQLIILTTGNALTDVSVYRQFVYSATTEHYTGMFRQRTESMACYLCGSQSLIATEDNASIPTFTCWQHSEPRVSTRLSNVAVVDLQFLCDATSDEVICRLRLVNGADAGRSGLTIAELVLSSDNLSQAEFWTEQASRRVMSEQLNEVNLETAHALSCPDEHHNVEDLFPSIPVVGAPGYSGFDHVRHYDTTVGRVVDWLHCIANSFQRRQ